MRSSTSNSDGRARALHVALVLLLVLVGANVLLNALFHKKEYQALAVLALTPDKELLALGSSRVLFGFDPRAYAVPSASLPANYLDLVRARQLFGMYGAKLPRLRVALIEFDTATLRYDTDAMNPNGLYDLGFSTIPTGREWLANFDRSLHKLLAPVFNWRLTPAFYYLQKRTTEGIEPLAAVPGHIPSAVSLAYPDFYAENEVRSTASELAAAKPGVYPANLAAAAGLIQDLRARGVTPVLLRFPHEPSLRKIYPPEWHAFVAQAYQELGRLTPGTPPAFWDLSGEEQFATAHFRDPDHLNQKGAELLARILAPKLAALLK